MHKHSAEVIGKQDRISNLVHCQVQPMIIVDNMMHSIINLNHLMIITNINSRVIIEQHNKLPNELIMIKKKWINAALLIVE